MAETTAVGPDPTNKKLELGQFTFKRKKTTGTYTALQLAVPVSKLLKRGKDAGKVVVVPDIKPFMKLSEREIREFGTSQGVNITKALILGISKCLKMKASGGGMSEDVILWLMRDGVSTDIADKEKRMSVLRAKATAICSYYREKNREKKSKKWTLEFTYQRFMQDDDDDE